MISELIEQAKAVGAVIATAESCTGGLVAATFTDIPGSSSVFDAGFVTYSNSAKVQMLDVSQSTLDNYGAVSAEVAQEMASGALQRSNATIAVAITGIAGPGGSDLKPEGRVCFALSTAQGTRSETIEFGPLGRAQVRNAARDHALALIAAAVKG